MSVPGRSPVELVTRLAHTPNAQLFVTTHDPALIGRLDGAKFDVVQVLPLKPAAVARCAAEIVAPKVLPDAAVASLASHDRLPLWVRLASRDLVAIAGTELQAAQVSPNPSDALNLLVIARAAALPDTIDGLVVRLLDRVATRISTTQGLAGADHVQRLVGALALARDGLRPPDLVNILGDDQSLIVAMFLDTLDPLLAPSGPGGALEFASRAVANAAGAWAQQPRDITHRAIAGALAAQVVTDPLRSSSLVWHAACGGDGQQLGSAISSILRDGDDYSRLASVDQLEQALGSAHGGDRSAATDAFLATRGISPAVDFTTYLVDAYWNSLRMRPTAEVPDLITRHAISVSTRRDQLDASGTPLANAEALLARADHLASRSSWQEAEPLLLQADQMLVRIVKDRAEIETRARISMLRILRIKSKHLELLGKSSTIFREQMTLNFVNKVRTSESTLDITVLRELVDNHLHMERVMERNGHFALAADALSPVRLYLTQCERFMDANDVWVATRELQISAARLRLAMYHLGDFTSCHEPLVNIRTLLHSSVIGPAPSNVDGAALSIEFDYSLARTSWATGDREQALRRCSDARSQAELRVAAGIADDDNRRHLILSCLMDSELARLLEREPQWRQSLSRAFEVYRDSPKDSLVRADTYAILRTHAATLIALCRPETTNPKSWTKLVKPFFDKRPVDRFPASEISPVVGELLGQVGSLGEDPRHRQPNKGLREYHRRHLFALDVPTFLATR
jgi:hypothetical protein